MRKILFSFFLGISLFSMMACHQKVQEESTAPIPPSVSPTPESRPESLPLTPETQSQSQPATQPAESKPLTTETESAPATW